MGSAKPGAKLGEKDIGTNSQQEGLLLNEAIAASIKKSNREEMCQYVRLMGQIVQGCVCFGVHVCAQERRKMGQFVRLINHKCQAYFPFSFSSSISLGHSIF